MHFLIKMLFAPFYVAEFIVYKPRAFFVGLMFLIYCMLMVLPVFNPQSKVWKIILGLLEYLLTRDFTFWAQLAFVSFIWLQTFITLYEFLNEKKQEKIKAKVKSKPKVEIRYEPEKVQPNSSFEVIDTLPSFQASIYTLGDDDEYHPKGQGFRYQEYFITANHVIEDTEKVKIIGKDPVIIDSERFTSLEVDVAYVKLTSKEMSVLGLSTCKMAQVVPGSGMFCQVAAFGKRSMGILKPHNSFGFVEYAGSTVAGFSGAPYYTGRMVFGMHTGGDVKNVGFDVTYVKALLGHEDSSEWLVNQVERFNSKFEYEISPFSPDEYILRVGGKYHIVDQDTFDKISKSRTKSNVKKIQYDFESLEKELSFLGKRHPQEEGEIPQPLKGVKKAQDLEPVPQTKATFSDNSIVDVSKKELRPTARQNAPKRNSTSQNDQGSKSRSPKKTSATNGPKSTPARQRNPLTSTTGSIKEPDSNPNWQELREMIRCLSQQISALNGSINPGGQTSKPQTSPTNGSTESSN